MAGMRVALAVAFGIGIAGCSGAADGGGLKWQKEPQKAFELASFTGRPMVLYFTSDG